MTFLEWFLIFMILFSIIGIIKAEVTYKNYCKIYRALRGYRAACRVTHREPVVSVEDMVDYGKSAWRIFDWSCKHILPKDKFEIIKPFMED